MDASSLRALLGPDAALLDAPGPVAPPPASRLPGPDYVARVWERDAPNAAWLRALHALVAAGRPGGTGPLVLLAATGDGAAALAEEGGCSALLTDEATLDAAGRRYAPRVPLIVRVTSAAALAAAASPAARARALRLAGALGLSLPLPPAPPPAASAAGRAPLERSPAPLERSPAPPPAASAAGRAGASDPDALRALAAAAAAEGLLVLAERSPDDDGGAALTGVPGLALAWGDGPPAPAAPWRGALAAAPLGELRRALAASLLARRAGGLGVVVVGEPGDPARDVAALHAIQDLWDAPGVRVG